MAEKKGKTPFQLLPEFQHALAEGSKKKDALSGNALVPFCAEITKALSSFASAFPKDKRWRYSRSFEEYLKEWRNLADAKTLPYFEARHLSDCLYSHGLLEVRPDLPWLERWYKQAKSKTERFTPREYSNTLQAHAMIRMRPDPLWLERWVESSRDKLSEPGFTPEILSTCLYSFGALNMRPDPKWLDAWYEAARAKLSSFQPDELSQTLFSLAMLQRCETPGCLSMAEDVLKKIELTPAAQFNSIDQNQIYLACLGMEQPFPGKFPIAKLSRFLWLQRGHSSTAESHIEETLKELIQTRKISGVLKKPDFHKVTLSSIDFSLTVQTKTGEEHKIFIQVDDPPHYVEDQDGVKYLNGQTSLQNYILDYYAKSTEHLVRLPLHEVPEGQLRRKGNARSDYVLEKMAPVYAEINNTPKPGSQLESGPASKPEPKPKAEPTYTYWPAPPSEYVDEPEDEPAPKPKPVREPYYLRKAKLAFKFVGKPTNQPARASEPKHGTTPDTSENASTDDADLIHTVDDLVNQCRKDVKRIGGFDPTIALRSALAEQREVYNIAEDDPVAPTEIVRLISLFATRHRRLKGSQADAQTANLLDFCKNVAAKDFGISADIIDLAAVQTSRIDFMMDDRHRGRHMTLKVWRQGDWDWADMIDEKKERNEDRETRRAETIKTKRELEEKRNNESPGRKI